MNDFITENWAAKILATLNDVNHLRRFCTVLETDVDLHVPTITSAAAEFTEEGEVFREVEIGSVSFELSAQKITSSLRISEELLEDSPYRLNSLLTSKMAQAISDLEYYALLFGDGRGMPERLYDQLDAARVFSKSLDYDSLIDLVYSIPRGLRDGAVWFLPKKLLVKIYKLKDASGHRILEKTFTNKEGLDVLLGFPVVYHEFDDNVVYFGDFSFLFLGIRSDLEVRTLEQLDPGWTNVLAKIRLDYRLVNQSAVACCVFLDESSEAPQYEVRFTMLKPYDGTEEFSIDKIDTANIEVYRDGVALSPDFYSISFPSFESISPEEGVYYGSAPNYESRGSTTLYPQSGKGSIIINVIN